MKLFSNKKNIVFRIFLLFSCAAALFIIPQLNVLCSAAALCTTVQPDSPFTAAYAASKQFDSTLDLSKLYAKYAVLLDGDNGRILAGKNEHDAAPMASTTKIMTCVTALEYCSPDFICTTSAYAASMPDVQLNATRGELFVLNDLLYSLMLKSHNDTAVIVAENTAYNYVCSVLDGTTTDTYSIIQKYVRNDSADCSAESTVDRSGDQPSYSADSVALSNSADFLTEHLNYDSSFLSSLTTDQSQYLVQIFTSIMNAKAAELGCSDTHFVTPNGLDSEDDGGIHHTTASDLALIMSYCIKNSDFLSITQTKSYSFTSVEKQVSEKMSNNPKNNSSNAADSTERTDYTVLHNGITYSVSNANAFLGMYDNIISGKTGFTGDAGYCYICAYQCDGRTFIVALLACGWPGNKTYKWHDARMLLDYARNNYYYQQIIDHDMQLKTVPVAHGMADLTGAYTNETYGMLLGIHDVINVVIDLPDVLPAPVQAGSTIGTIDVYVNDSLVKQIPVYASDTIKRKTYVFFMKKVLNELLFIDKNE